VIAGRLGCGQFRFANLTFLGFPAHIDRLPTPLGVPATGTNRLFTHFYKNRIGMNRRQDPYGNPAGMVEIDIKFEQLR